MATRAPGTPAHAPSDPTAPFPAWTTHPFQGRCSPPRSVSRSGPCPEPTLSWCPKAPKPPPPAETPMSQSSGRKPVSIPVQAQVPAPTRPGRETGGKGPRAVLSCGRQPHGWEGRSWLSPTFAGSLAARGSKPAPRGRGLWRAPILLRVVQPQAQLHPRGRCQRAWEVAAASWARQPLLRWPEHACQIPCGHPPAQSGRSAPARATPQCPRPPRHAWPTQHIHVAPAGSTPHAALTRDPQPACLLSRHPHGSRHRLRPLPAPVHSLRPWRPSQGP